MTSALSVSWQKYEVPKREEFFRVGITPSFEGIMCSICLEVFKRMDPVIVHDLSDGRFADPLHIRCAVSVITSEREEGPECPMCRLKIDKVMTRSIVDLPLSKVDIECYLDRGLSLQEFGLFVIFAARDRDIPRLERLLCQGKITRWHRLVAIREVAMKESDPINTEIIRILRASGPVQF
jgi:hypothetical protein